MKTVKVVLIATLLVFTTMNVTNADGFKIGPKSKIIHIALAEAVKIPGLTTAMLMELNPGFMGCGCQTQYTASVRFLNINYLVLGTEQDWRAFFNWGYISLNENHSRVVADN